MREGFVPWPQELAAEYVEKGYWRGVPLGAWLWEWAQEHGDRVALVDGGTRLTYRELAETADRLAVRLRDDVGLRPGETLLVQLPNTWDLVVLTFACFRLGVTPVMALPAHRRHELTYLAQHSEAAAIAVPDRLRDFDHEALAHEVAGAAAGVRSVLVVGDARPGSTALRELMRPAEDPVGARRSLDAAAPSSREVAVFLLSGGTTGLPKLISRTHDDYAFNARRSAEVCGFGADTVYLVSLPAGHNFPLASPGILGTLAVGGRVVLVPSPSPGPAFAAMRAEGVTVTAVVPAVAQRWLDAVAGGEQEAPPSLAVLQVGGARMAPELGARVRPVLGCTLQQVFGMAEGLLNYTRLDDPEEVIVETQGRPICPDDEIRIVDEADDPVPAGQMGALLTRGPYTPRGYYRAPEHNAKAFTPDGWYRTGDVVRQHPSGNLVVMGRDKDLINRGGEKISAEEVENLVYRVPGVARVAAVALPDAALGERVAVCVVPTSGARVDLDALRTALQDMGVAAFKLPEHLLLLLEELPLTKVGKIDKQGLRSLLAEGVGEAGP